MLVKEGTEQLVHRRRFVVIESPDNRSSRGDPRTVVVRSTVRRDQLARRRRHERNSGIVQHIRRWSGCGGRYGLSGGGSGSGGV